VHRIRFRPAIRSGPPLGQFTALPQTSKAIADSRGSTSKGVWQGRERGKGRKTRKERKGKGGGGTGSLAQIPGSAPEDKQQKMICSKPLLNIDCSFGDSAPTLSWWSDCRGIGPRKFYLFFAKTTTSLRYTALGTGYTVHTYCSITQPSIPSVCL